MARGRTAPLFRKNGVWYVSWWKGGTRVKAHSSEPEFRYVEQTYISFL